MSRSLITPTRGSICFPRVSGDEPESSEEGDSSASFSPREQG